MSFAQPTTDSIELTTIILDPQLAEISKLSEAQHEARAAKLDAESASTSYRYAEESLTRALKYLKREEYPTVEIEANLEEVQSLRAQARVVRADARHAYEIARAARLAAEAAYSQQA